MEKYTYSRTASWIFNKLLGGRGRRTNEELGWVSAVLVIRTEEASRADSHQQTASSQHPHSTAGVRGNISGHVRSGSVPSRGSNAPPVCDGQHWVAGPCGAGARIMKDLKRKKGAQRCRCPCWRSALCSAPWPWSLTGCRRLCPRSWAWTPPGWWRLRPRERTVARLWVTELCITLHTSEHSSLVPSDHSSMCAQGSAHSRNILVWENGCGIRNKIN